VSRPHEGPDEGVGSSATLPLVDHYDNVTGLIALTLNVELYDVFVLEDVVAVDHLTLVFGFAPDAGIL